MQFCTVVSILDSHNQIFDLTDFDPNSTEHPGERGEQTGHTGHIEGSDCNSRDVLSFHVSLKNMSTARNKSVVKV